MDELEQLRQRKLSEIQSQQVEAQKIDAQITQAENLVRQIMTKEALSRWGNIKLAHPDVTTNALTIILQGISAGKLRRIDDSTLKEILKSISGHKHNINIKRK